MDKGLFQIYTGNGKGKTTAALGVAIRAAGYGMNVKIIQFMKGREYGEHLSFENISGIEIFPEGTKDCITKEDVNEKHIKSAANALKKAENLLRNKECNILILDEINVAIWFELISVDEALNIVDIRPPETELIFTGRYAPEKLIERADLVSSVEIIKHPYQQGIDARKGIEY